MLAPVAALLALPLVVAQGLRTLAPAEMREDLLELGDALTGQHAGLARYTAPADFDEFFGAALSAVEQGPRDVLWFHRRVCELLAAVRCGHTRALLGEGDRQAALAARGLLPLEVHWSGERAWIVRVLAEGVELRPGQELSSIDGLPTAEIRARACARLSDDGFIETGKERELARDFAELYALLVSEASGTYRVAVEGVAEPVELAGLASEAFEVRRTRRAVRPVVRLELFPEDDAGLLTVSAFGDPPAGQPGYFATLETSFATLREQKLGHLILDLRGNGGGRDMYGAGLVSYLAAKPFRYFERIEVTPDYAPSEPVEVVERDGRRLMLSHDGLQEQQPAALHFTGDVAILIDGWTFSTAADVATVAHHLRLATFLGEETGGGYDGNTSGDSMRLVLRHSRLTVGIPKWMYTTANLGHAHAGRGVRPDVTITPSIEDVLAGRDVVLERALARAREPRAGR